MEQQGVIQHGATNSLCIQHGQVQYLATTWIKDVTRRIHNWYASRERNPKKQLMASLHLELVMAVNGSNTSTGAWRRTSGLSGGCCCLRRKGLQGEVGDGGSGCCLRRKPVTAAAAA